MRERIRVNPQEAGSPTVSQPHHLRSTSRRYAADGG